MIKRSTYYTLFALCLFVKGFAQPSNPAPYCTGNYANGTCNQPNASNNTSNFINDFINDFITTGANVNINNGNSGCNPTGGPTNYYNYSCVHHLEVTPGQTITVSMRSGITFMQGFSIWVDWNQDNVFQNPGEQVAATSNVPAANTWTTLTFVVPSNLGNGAYRMRAKCAYATNGTNLTPCGNFGYGETEDYTIFIGPVPSNIGIVTATASSNSPLCSGQTLSLNVAANGTGLTYTWTGPGNYSSTAQNPVIANTTGTTSGTYTVIASNSTCPASRTVAVQVVNYPVFNATPSTPTICQGGSFNASASFSSAINIAAYHFQWAPTPTAGVFSPLTQNTSITPPLLPTTQSLGTMIYSITVTPTALNCPTMRTLTVTINNPLTPTLTVVSPVCNTVSAVQFTADPPGGIWINSNNNAVNSSGILSPGLASIGTNTVGYAVTVGSCQVQNTATFAVAKFHTAALSSSLNLICVQDPQINLMNLVQDTVTGIWSSPFVSQGKYFNPSGLPSGVYTLTYNTVSTPASLYAGVCPHSTVFSVQVFSPPVPTIDPIAPKCSTAPTVALTASPLGGVWSNNPGVSTTGIQTPSLNNTGTNTVSYTAGQGTCVATSSATFHVSQFRPATITGTVGDRCFNSAPSNLMSIVQSTTGTWSGINVNNNVFNPLGLQTGTYTLTYSNTSFPNATLCPDSHTTSVYVLSPQTPVITQAGPVCSRDGSLQLSVSPALGHWVALNYLTPNGVFIPSLAPVGNNAIQYVIGTPTCNITDTKYISVEAFVPASITGQLPDLCDNSLPVSLNFITQNSSGRWSGMGVQGTSFNPALTGAGSFLLQYTTSSSPSGLCPDQSTISVRVFSLAPPIISDAGPYCNTGAPVQLTVSPVGGIFGGNNTQAVSPSGMFNPGTASIGDNLVSYSIATGPCVAHAQKTITIVKFISAAMGAQPLPAYCKNAQPFDLNMFASNPGGNWAGPGVSGSMFSPTNAAEGANTIRYQTFSAGIPTLCPDENTISINIETLPPVNAVAVTYSACAPAEIPFSTPNLNGAEFEWHFGDGSEPYTGSYPSHVFVRPGNYSVTLNYAKGACHGQASVLRPITIKASPVADFRFSKDEVTIADPQVDLINLTSDIASNRYRWTFEGLGESFDVSPAITFTQTGSYQVRLVATNYDGCADEVTKTLFVKNEFGMFMPNSFTPNFDGLNDVFRPVFTPFGLDMKTFELEVFDRWGVRMFRSTDPARGWDGTIGNKGEELVKEGVYVWTLRYRDLDGRQYNETGHVSVIKR